MITRQESAAQIGRFSIFGLAYSKLDQTAVDEYIRALCQCRDVSDASNIVTECIHDSDKMPSVAAIVARQRALAESRSYAEIPDERVSRGNPPRYGMTCRNCANDGFTFDDETGWDWCPCAIGDRRREEEAKLVPDAQTAWEKLMAKCGSAIGKAVVKAL